jgi:hypothetical protein
MNFQSNDARVMCGKREDIQVAEFRIMRYEGAILFKGKSKNLRV